MYFINRMIYILIAKKVENQTETLLNTFPKIVWLDSNARTHGLNARIEFQAAVDSSPTGKTVCFYVYSDFPA